jgi:hypothetical protein
MGMLLWLVTEKEDPDTLRLEIVTEYESKLTTVILPVADWPTDTEPKLRLVGVNSMLSPIDAPPQPVRATAR